MRVALASSAAGVIMAVAVLLGPLVAPQSRESFPGWSMENLAALCCSLLLALSGALRFREGNGTAHAAQDERRRLARELHDGVLQELTLIQLESTLLPSDNGIRDRVLDACDRAVTEARRLLEDMREDDRVPLAPALSGPITDLAERYRIALDLRLDGSVNADGEQRHNLLRIAREAVSNAARHGGATRITVLLRTNGATHELEIRDDGTGFDRSFATDGGFGLTSMRERAESLPGKLEIDSRTATGSRVMVAW